jgi:transcription-repair coupling factor (superfamily II helicase)
MIDWDRLAQDPGHITCTRCPQGYDILASTQMLSQRGGRGLFIARDSREAKSITELMEFFAPALEVLFIPAWDTQPFDRISPAASLAAQRTAALTRLTEADGKRPLMVVASVPSLSQRCAPASFLQAARFSARAGNVVLFDALEDYLSRNGYERVPTVREAGEYAMRGGVVDIYSPQYDTPFRFDFFGDTLESIRPFDPESQRTTGSVEALKLTAVSEVALDADSVSRFRTGFRRSFGIANKDDLIYRQLSEGLRAQGTETFLPLFHDGLSDIFSLLGEDAICFVEHLADKAWDERDDLIADLVRARTDAAGSPEEARILEPDTLFIGRGEFQRQLDSMAARLFTAFDAPDSAMSMDLQARPARDFAPERKAADANIFDAAANYLIAKRKEGRRIIFASWSDGSSERTGAVMADHGLALGDGGADWLEAIARAEKGPVRIVLPLEHGFETPDLLVLSEQDVLGDRMASPRKRKRAKNFIAELASLSPGDLVVHVDHGIGRFRGLKHIDIQGAVIDCLDLEYASGGTLLLPATNIDLLSRYGGDNSSAVLDRMGGAGWQSRKAKAKKRLRDMAEELIRLAAQRELKRGEVMDLPQGDYSEFAARFPYVETDDQLNAIDDALSDLGSGKPMDRLICGDVGFGKTEVALRAAFTAAMNGKQVAIVCPTTLLARQHYRSFEERFRGWPIKVAQLSRLVPAREATAVRNGLKDGSVEIVVGTHALLAKTVGFKDLGLLIVDEEQHFGVRHKERLKAMRADVHVMTLTATPIPRTLQMSLSGLRDLSIIATPPVDRLAVRTYVAPFDGVTIREALLRERYRGGQSFFVVPRIADLAKVEEFLTERVPEISYVTATGQLAPAQLEERINAFYDGQYDVLLSTPIVESGLDIPTANTLVVWRADRFGLAQLYQLRGRVGRSKLRAFAYLTTPSDWSITREAEQRLKVLSSLDELGAGFTLASHDLDMRGGGNLLGEEQSGHIRDVGVELFQQMLEDAITQLRDDPQGDDGEDEWSPKINLGVSVLIPETYVPDLDLRLSLYRRVTNMDTSDEREQFAAELIDRFGKLPDEVEFLLGVLDIKAMCRTLGIEKLDAGAKGGIAQFRPNALDEVDRLIAFVTRHSGQFGLRPDGSLVLRGDYPNERARVRGIAKMLKRMVSEVAGGDMHSVSV